MQVLKPHLERYPRSYAFLQKDLHGLPAKDPRVWQLFREHANLTDKEARAAVTMGSVPPVIFAQNLGPVVWAQFDPDTPNRIEIGMDTLERFEQAATDPAAQSFLRSKALHEMCHWGCHRAHVADPDTAGELFEVAAFGAEQRPWWTAAVAPAYVAGAVPSVFTNPAARAAALVAQLTKPGHVPGRADDPDHKVFGGADVAEAMPRGYRNNNPGNIRVKDSWNGLAMTDEQTAFQRAEKSFCVFREPEWGLRAIAYLLRKYKNSYGISTPRKIIARWAPASDGNDVESYSTHLAAALGVRPDDTVDADNDDVAVAMVQAIATHENGARPPYSTMQFQTALRLL